MHKCEGISTRRSLATMGQPLAGSQLTLLRFLHPNKNKLPALAEAHVCPDWIPCEWNSLELLCFCNFLHLAKHFVQLITTPSYFVTTASLILPYTAVVHCLCALGKITQVSTVTSADVAMWHHICWTTWNNYFSVRVYSLREHSQQDDDASER